MKGISFCCPEDKMPVKIDALILINNDVYLIGTCDCCNEQLRFGLASMLLKMIPEPKADYTVN